MSTVPVTERDLEPIRLLLTQLRNEVDSLTESLRKANERIGELTETVREFPITDGPDSMV